MSRRGARGWWAFRPGLETLEGRRVPAQFGVPWHDPEHLSVSFVPDGTVIAGNRSSLFGLLDAAEPTATWQGEVLRAFQTWANAARVNFSVVPDDGTPLGVPGPDQGDPRFGDIRIGARPMSPEVLAISVPHDPFLSGTWSGDILLNSNIAFGKDVSLTPVILHEVGHVLGLDESPDPRSVMFGHLDQANTALSPEDVRDVEALYGPRAPDPFEGPGGNDLPQTATPLPVPAGFDGSTPLFLYADITTPNDVDVFSFQPPAGYSGPVTIRVQTAGVSLLAPQFSVLDANGTAIARASSTALMGDTLQVTLPAVEAGATYRVQIQGAPGDVIGAGKYALAVSFDGRSTVGPDAIDRLARQSYDYLSPADIEAIFRDPRGALFGVDRHSNDTLATATKERSIGAYGSLAPFRLTASLSDQRDVDFYRIETPEEDDSDRPLVMTATVRVTEVNGLASRISVFDRDGRPVPAIVLAHGAGTYTIQVAGARPDSTYFVRVDHDPATAAVTGNYELDIEFGNQAAAPVDFAGGTLDARNPRAEYELVVNEVQLFDFLLSGLSALPGSQPSLQMTITDLQGRTIATLSTRNGQTRSDSLVLFPGHYRVTFDLETDGSGLRPPFAFRLYGASLSDPIGPALDDRSLDPGSDALHSDAPPPVVGAPDAPYVWLARTLAAQPEPAEASAPAPGNPGIARSGGASGALAIASSSSLDVHLLLGGASPVAVVPAGPGIRSGLVVQDIPRSFGRWWTGRRFQDGQGGSSLDHANVLPNLGGEGTAVADVALEVPAGWPRWNVMRSSFRAPDPRSRASVATEPGAETVRLPAAVAPSAARSPWTSAAVGFGPQAGAVLWLAAVAYFYRHRYAGWFARLTRLASWRSGKTTSARLPVAHDFFQRLRFSFTLGKRRRTARRGSAIGGLRWRLPTLHGQAHW